MCTCLAPVHFLCSSCRSEASDNAGSGSEKQTSDFGEDGDDIIAEEGGEDMTGTSEFTVEHDEEIEGAIGENEEMLPVVADMASITNDNVGSENDSRTVPGLLLVTISSVCNVGDTVIAANNNLVVEERPSDETGRSKRKRVPRQMPDALNGCLCRIVVDSLSDGVLECKKLGCEMQWYHLDCILLDIVPRNWVCEACEASGTSRGTKRS
ncbi:uncharacterized protein LACBIDRAFT_309694 [Laccaria bicolor S238N-H82]|uniref:Predicted protein n=1 Tax=Laccaria bicolor (strain S238N-H82 / ATCC MYA-4686) TaxID=486041 RepID=B0DSV2_LACBS|nr:uncharacterized protein LACBIDRAFT_309694 [Laccaria bicolor S238N-H82]EDR02380.1 predicted protein [Laccaria bicolor S238N-H82]|eukprot:XP_001887057.1 predicted protein [Laccaria bicolor S238N-H82]